MAGKRGRKDSSDDDDSDRPSKSSRGRSSPASHNQDDTASNSNAIPIFLKKTYRMIETCDPTICSWTDDGDMFVVKNPVRDSLEAMVTPDNMVCNALLMSNLTNSSSYLALFAPWGVTSPTTPVVRAPLLWIAMVLQTNEHSWHAGPLRLRDHPPVL